MNVALQRQQDQPPSRVRMGEWGQGRRFRALLAEKSLCSKQNEVGTALALLHLELALYGETPFFQRRFSCRIYLDGNALGPQGFEP